MILRILLVILLSGAISVGVLAATVGNLDDGGDNVLGNIEGIERCLKVTPTTSGTATNITWFTYQTGAQNSRGMIYEYVSDTDAGALLATSTEDAGAIDNAWRTGTLTLSLAASTSYFACAFSEAAGGTVNIGWVNTGGAHLQDTKAYPTPSDPFAEDATGDDLLSIYITYTETSTGVTRIVGGGVF